MDLQEIKTIIRSLVISLPSGMTISKLEKDFRASEGVPIPYGQFRCSSTEMFLSTIPDTVKIHGYGPFATVVPVITEKVAHIENMVMQQKPATSKCRAIFTKKRQRGIYQSRGTTDKNQQSIPSLLSLKIPATSFDSAFAPNKLVHAVNDQQNHLCQVASPNQSAALVSEEICSEDSFVYSSDDEDVLELTDDFTNHIPTVIKDNLKVLIKENEEGIWCAKLPELYRLRFGKTINFQEYGYTRLISMCSDLKLFHAVRVDNGDHRLYDIDKPLPTHAHLSFTSPKYVQAEDFAPHEPAILNEHDLIIKQITYPDDVFKPGEEIPAQWLLPDMQKDTFIEIRVGEVYDISKFWIFIQHPDCGDKLQTMMSDMNHYYQTNHMHLKLDRDSLKKKMLVCSMYMGEYHRAMVVKFLVGDVKVKVYYFDYGTVDTVKISSLCYLHRSFGSLPRQAIRARLVGIYPVHLDTQWSREAASRFLVLVSDKRLVAYLHRVDIEFQELGVVLYDTENGNDTSIGDILVDEGYAVNNRKKRGISPYPKSVVPVVQNIHLFPMFSEFEMAEVPNALETNNFLRNGCGLDFIYPHYFVSAAEDESEVENAAQCLESLSLNEKESPLEGVEHQDTDERIDAAANVDCSTNNSLNTSWWKGEKYMALKSQNAPKANNLTNDEKLMEESQGVSSTLNTPSNCEELANGFANAPSKSDQMWADMLQQEEMKPMPKLPPGFSKDYLFRRRLSENFNISPNYSGLPSPFRSNWAYPSPASAIPSPFASPFQFPTSPPISDIGSPTCPLSNPVTCNNVPSTTLATLLYSLHECQNPQEHPFLGYLTQNMNIEQQLLLAQYLKQREDETRLSQLMQQTGAYPITSFVNPNIIDINNYPVQTPNIHSTALYSSTPFPDYGYGCAASTETSIAGTKECSDTRNLQYDIRQHRKNLFKMVLDNKTVHVVKFEDELYMLTDEITAHFTKFGHLPFKKRLKSIIMSGCSTPFLQINLVENISLLNALKLVNSEDKQSTNFLNVIPLKKIAEFLNSLPESETHNFINWNEVHKHVLHKHTSFVNPNIIDINNYPVQTPNIHSTALYSSTPFPDYGYGCAASTETSIAGTKECSDTRNLQYDIRQHRKNLFKMVLDNKTVHVVKFEDELYMLTDEITAHFTKFGHLPFKKRLKSIIMSGCSTPFLQINLVENISLLNALKLVNSEDKQSTNFLNVIPLKKIAEFLNSLPESETHNFINWNEVHKHVEIHAKNV